MPKYNSDIFVPGAPAIQYSAAGQKWTIGKNADVGSTSFGIYSVFNNSKLVNKGYIYSYSSAAIYFTGNNTNITIQKLV